MSLHSPSISDGLPRVEIRDTFAIGVIIPTYNRSDVLMDCLKRLEEQTWKDFEVVVVDDGSTDDTLKRLAEYAAGTALTLRWMQQENSGPARARNQGAVMLRSPVCLMIGDDILATPTLVETHLALHRSRPEASIAGLGYTRWSSSGQQVTPFMRWLDTSGMQFAYGDLLAGSAPTWHHFYSSNLSLKTSHLRANPFHEGFRKAATEDSELGYRLHKRNALEIIFLREAVADHLHPTTVRQACRRMISVGESAYVFEQLWPEQRREAPRGLLKRTLRSFLLDNHWILPRLCDAAAWATHMRCPNPLLTRVLSLHNTFGYTRATERARHAQQAGIMPSAG
jgi:glycosyltransferase involved in cell wall biosynthesis